MGEFRVLRVGHTPFVFRHDLVLIVALAWFRARCFIMKIRIFF